MKKDKVLYKIKVKDENGTELVFKIKCYEMEYAKNLIKNIMKDKNYKIKGVIVENYEN